MMGIRQHIREASENYEMKKDSLILAGYLSFIKEDQGVKTDEEAMMICYNDTAAQIGWKMKVYGLYNLKTKKGRQKFRDTQLTPEEIEVWDSPERPDNIAKLIAIGTVETVRYAKHKIKKQKC